MSHSSRIYERVVWRRRPDFSVWGEDVVARPTPEHCMSVLVVAADLTQRESLRVALGEHYHLAFAAGMDEALRAVQQRRPDLLVSEVDLPDGTGLQLCAHLRAQPGGSRLPIMLVTSRSSTEDKIAGMQAGADDFVVKPLDGRMFTARLRLLVRLKGIERPRDLHLPQEA